MKTTLKKSDALRMIINDYLREHGETSLDTIVDYALDHGLYELDPSRIKSIARTDFQKAVKDCDAAGNRLYYSRRVNQQYLWNLRELASFEMKQQFVDEQVKRIGVDIDKLKRDVAYMNSELRKEGEADIQLILPFDE